MAQLWSRLRATLMGRRRIAEEESALQRRPTPSCHDWRRRGTHARRGRDGRLHPGAALVESGSARGASVGARPASRLTLTL